MNHDVRHRQPEHDKLAKDIAEFEKTHKIEVIPFGVVSDPQGYKYGSFVERNGRVLFSEGEDD